MHRDPGSLASFAVAHDVAAAVFVGVVGTGVQAIVQNEATAKAAYQAK